MMTHGNDDLYEKRIAKLEHSQELSEMLIYEAQKRIEELKQENAELEAELAELREVYRCAAGLCHGEDWNGGTAALYYRKPLREAVEKAKAALLPEEGK